MEYEKVAEFSIRTSIKRYLFRLFATYLKKYGSAEGFNQLVEDNPDGLIEELGFDVSWVLIFSDWPGNYLHSRPKRAYKPPSKITTEEWLMLQERYDFKCFYCGQVGRLTKDHVFPVSKGGEDIIENIVPACLSCNRKKGVKIYETAK